MTLGQVAVTREMIHQTRVIPTVTSPPVGSTVRSWLGQSQGRWDGDTLVVETTGVNGRGPFQGSSEES